MMRTNAPRRPDGFDFAAAFALVGAVLFAGYLAGCTPARSAAEAADAAEQVACVDKSATKDEAIACQNAVRAKWAASPNGGAP